MMNTLPLAVLEEGNAVILKDQWQNPVIIFGIADKHADFPIAVIALPHKPQNIGSRRLQFDTAVGRFHQLQIFRRKLGGFHLSKQFFFQPAKRRILRTMIMRKQGDGLPKALPMRLQFLH